MDFPIALAFLLSLQFLLIDSLDTDVCMNGTYHKKTPSKETADFKACHAWKDKSCCTANFTVELSRHRVKNIWNFHWDHCSDLSQVICYLYLYFLKRYMYHLASCDMYKPRHARAMRHGNAFLVTFYASYITHYVSNC